MKSHFPSPHLAIKTLSPSHPTLFFSQNALKERLSIFQEGFPGLVSFAVKSNPHNAILETFHNLGLNVYDVASPNEITRICEINPKAVLHYNNPIRSLDEIEFALEKGVKSFSVDCEEELEKLARFKRPDLEVSIRLKLDLEGAAYHFGEKFGVGIEEAVSLLKSAKALEFITSMTFHVGTQCERPELYTRYMEACAKIAKTAEVQLHNLNVGGGFPSHRKKGQDIDYGAYFDAIKDGLRDFDELPPQLICEPGRGLVADAGTLLVKVKSLRANEWIFLNDGIYGGLSEINIIPLDTYQALHTNGLPKTSDKVSFTAYGPTCDSLDMLHEKLYLPEDIKEGDYILFKGTGAYSVGVNTNFNGYGDIDLIFVEQV